MQHLIDNYEDISLVNIALQPVKSGLHTMSSLLELGTDTIEEIREDLRATASKERKLMQLKVDVKIAKYGKILDSYTKNKREIDL